MQESDLRIGDIVYPRRFECTLEGEIVDIDRTVHSICGRNLHFHVQFIGAGYKYISKTYHPEELALVDEFDAWVRRVRQENNL